MKTVFVLEHEVEYGDGWDMGYEFVGVFESRKDAENYIANLCENSGFNFVYYPYGFRITEKEIQSNIDFDYKSNKFKFIAEMSYDIYHERYSDLHLLYLPNYTMETGKFYSDRENKIDPKYILQHPIPHEDYMILLDCEGSKYDETYKKYYDIFKKALEEYMAKEKEY